MKIAKKLTAVATALSLAVACAVAPGAGAVDFRQNSDPERSSFSYTKDGTVAGDVSIQSLPMIRVDGQEVNLENFSVPAGENPLVNVYEDKNVKVEDTRAFDDDVYTHTVTVTNTADTAKQMQTDIYTGIGYGNNSGDAYYTPDGVDFSGGEYAPRVSFSATGEDVLADVFNWKNQRNIVLRKDPYVISPGLDYYDLARSLQFLRLDPGQSMTMTVKLTFTIPPSALDSDGDGLPDDWETMGVPLENGQTLPLQAWGADPHKKDIFLQLNWMKSEMETQGCLDAFGRPRADVDKVTDYSYCTGLDSRSHAPTMKALEDLVKLFDDHGINLHIDAGDMVLGMPREAGGFGGPRMDYEKYYFGTYDGGGDHGKLKDQLKLVEGARQSVFRLGTLVDYLWGEPTGTPVRISGLGQMPGTSFAVGNFEGMNSDHVRNTILHEMGHTLGFGHAGRYYPDNPLNGKNYVPNHVSVMNYLYQWSFFDYMDHLATNSDPVSTVPYTCPLNGCFTGAYTVEPEWGHLTIGNYPIGTVTDSMFLPTPPVKPTPPPAEEEHHHTEATMHDLEVVSAEANKGVGAIDIVTSELVKARNDNFIEVQVRNKGADLHAFSVLLEYGDHVQKEPVYPVGAVDEQEKDANASVKKFRIDPSELSGDGLAVTAHLVNQSGEVVQTANATLPVLDLTRKDLEKAVKEAPAEKKKDAKRLLRNEETVDTAVRPVEKSKSEEPTTSTASTSTEPTRITASPQRTRPSTVPTYEKPTPEPTPEPTDEGLSTEAIIGIVFGVLGIGTLAAAIAAFLQGAL